MHRAHLAEIARAESIKDTGRLHELAPERLRRSAVIARMNAVGVERDRAFDLARHGPDADIDIERVQRRHDGGVEIRGRHRHKLDALLARVAGAQDQLMGAEIEIDLQRRDRDTASRQW